METKTKIKLLTAFIISSFVLVILFLAIQIMQERKLYHLEKRIIILENIILNNNFENVNYQNINYKDNSTFQRVGEIRDIVSSIDFTLKNIESKITPNYRNAYYQNIKGYGYDYYNYNTEREEWMYRYHTNVIYRLKRIDDRLHIMW